MDPFLASIVCSRARHISCGSYIFMELKTPCLCERPYSSFPAVENTSGGFVLIRLSCSVSRGETHDRSSSPNRARGQPPQPSRLRECT